jgi:hypothetical protein
MNASARSPSAAKKYVPTRKPAELYADRNGYVPFGQLVSYAGSRSDGCTSWSPSDVRTNHEDREGGTDDALHLS